MSLSIDMGAIAVPSEDVLRESMPFPIDITIPYTIPYKSKTPNFTPAQYMERAKPILDIMVRRIVKYVRPAKIILFGSFSRGTPHFYSDVDLLVVMEGHINRIDAAIKIRKLLADSPLAKDIVVTTTKDMRDSRDTPGHVIYKAIREGITLYAKGLGT